RPAVSGSGRSPDVAVRRDVRAARIADSPLETRCDGQAPGRARARAAVDRSMKRALAAALVVAGVSLSAQVFRGNADVVVLNVTVTDAESHFISGLERDNFKVLEDGLPQEIT